MSARSVLRKESFYGVQAPARELRFLSRALRRRSLTRDEVLAHQGRQLPRLVAHAYRNVPYYRELFDAHGLRPEHVRGLGDLERIPVTTKRQLQGRPAEEVIAQGLDPEGLLIFKTSGSTGEPAVIRRTPVEYLLGRALRLRRLADLGIRGRDRVAVLRSPWRESSRRRIAGVWAPNTCAPYRKRHIDCMQPPERVLRDIEAYRPDVVLGFPTVLSRVAEVIRGGRRPHTSPRLVITAGEVLTPVMRRDISAAFATPVRDLYSTYEFGVVGWECGEAEMYHTCDAGLVVEVLRDGRPVRCGERGVLVATALYAFAMPFLRYELGDVVTRGDPSCRCGEPFGTIEAIQGRMVDYLRLRNGRLVHAFEMVHALGLNTGGWVRQYQLIQESLDRVRLLVVPSRNLPSDHLTSLQRSAAGILGEDVAFLVTVQADIPLEPSGKFRPTRSLLESRYDDVEFGDPIVVEEGSS